MEADHKAFCVLAITRRAPPTEVKKRLANEGPAQTCCWQKAAHRLWVEVNGVRGSWAYKWFRRLNGGGAGSRDDVNFFFHSSFACL